MIGGFCPLSHANLLRLNHSRTYMRLLRYANTSWRYIIILYNIYQRATSAAVWWLIYRIIVIVSAAVIEMADVAQAVERRNNCIHPICVILCVYGGYYYDQFIAISKYLRVL
jgi:hypothetical protein